MPTGRPSAGPTSGSVRCPSFQHKPDTSIGARTPYPLEEAGWLLHASGPSSGSVRCTSFQHKPNNSIARLSNINQIIPLGRGRLPTEFVHERTRRASWSASMRELGTSPGGGWARKFIRQPSRNSAHRSQGTPTIESGGAGWCRLNSGGGGPGPRCVEPLKAMGGAALARVEQIRRGPYTRETPERGLGGSRSMGRRRVGQ
jgi:hypothetical protein